MSKVAVVTGGTGVLCRAMCHALAQQGMQVVILARTAENTHALAAEIGANALGIGADVLDRDSLQAAADQIVARFDQVDILINGAGGNRPGATTAPDRSFFDLLPQEVQGVFDLNFLGTFYASQIFGRIMAEPGVILNISSMAALRPLTRVVAYGSAKAAIDNFTRWLAVYMAPKVRVNAIAPGFFLADQNRSLLMNPDTGELTPRGQQIISHTPMGRFGEPDDLIGAMSWLISDAAQFVTGIVVPIDGGFSAFSGV